MSEGALVADADLEGVLEGLAAVPLTLHLSLYMTEITSKLSTALADRYRIERHLGEGGNAS